MRGIPVRPILASLRRHELVALLLVLQVAATCAVVCNVGFMIVTRLQRMHMPSGVDEQTLVLIRARELRPRSDMLSRRQTDLAALRAIPGVQSAAAVDSLPFSQDTWLVGSHPAGSAGKTSNDIPLTLYSGTAGELDTLGIKLLDGHDFASTDYVPMHVNENYAGLNDVDALIVSRSVAEHYFPGRHAVGHRIRVDDRDRRIIGVFDHLALPSPGRTRGPDYAVFAPMQPDGGAVIYVLHCRPRDCDAVGRRASDALLAASHDRLLQPPQHFTELRAGFFRRDETMTGLLLVAALGLLFVTALGIGGLANFWVQQRTRTIGIRRAVGATRGEILRYFQTENFLIVGCGIVLGMVLAYALNLLLMQRYELPHLPLYYLPLGALTLLALGQIAVLAPARRASRVAPVVATRSVA